MHKPNGITVNWYKHQPAINADFAYHVDPKRVVSMTWILANWSLHFFVMLFSLRSDPSFFVWRLRTSWFNNYTLSHNVHYFFYLRLVLLKKVYWHYKIKFCFWFVLLCVNVNVTVPPYFSLQPALLCLKVYFRQ